MKVLYHHRIRSKDGQFVHLQELVHAFEAGGHVVNLVGPRILESGEFGEGGGFSDTLRSKLPKVCFELLEFAYSLLALLRLWAALRKNRPDLIYERFNLFFPVGVWLANLHKIPIVLEVNGPLLQERSEHGGLSLKWLAGWSQNYVWNNATLCLPVTNVLANYLREVGVSEERILIIPNGVDFERFAVADRQFVSNKFGWKDKVVLGFIGFVRPWHGVDSIIMSMAEGKLPENTRLLVAGDGPALPDLKRMTHQLGLNERVVFTGVVSREDVPNYIAGFDIALQPSVVAWASPLKVIEYLAVGSAIVAPAQPNIGEILVHEENALLFDPAKPEDRIKMIVRLVESEPLRKVLGTNAVTTISKLSLTWSSNADRIIARLLSIKS